MVTYIYKLATIANIAIVWHMHAFTKLAIKLLVNTAKNIDKCVRTYIDNLLGHCITLYLHCCNVVHVREVLPR